MITLIATTGFDILLAFALIEAVVIVALVVALIRARAGNGRPQLPAVPTYEFEVNSRFPNEEQISPDERNADMEITLAMKGADQNWVAKDVVLVIGLNDLGQTITIDGKAASSKELTLDFGELLPNAPVTKHATVTTGLFAQVLLGISTAPKSAEVRRFTLPTRVECKLVAATGPIVKTDALAELFVDVSD